MFSGGTGEVIYRGGRKAGQYHQREAYGDQKASGHKDFRESPDHEPEDTGSHRTEAHGGGHATRLRSGEGMRI